VITKCISVCRLILLNTPSAYPVNRWSNTRHTDKSSGGVLIIWDRLFGIDEPEEEEVTYDVTTVFIGHDPLTVQFKPYLRGEWRRDKQIAAERGESRRTAACG
jgi:hypothetical protein